MKDEHAENGTWRRLVTNQPQQSLPCILACGYREIQSPKTALTFPAWLIQLNSGCAHWRSKKDFLLLFRATNKLAKSMVQCPKSALKKLASKAPWKCPESISANHRENNQGGKVTSDRCAESSNLVRSRNNYEASMTKNIHLLNSYLQSLAKLCVDDDNLHLSKAWSFFVRHQDTEGLLRVELSTLPSATSSPISSVQLSHSDIQSEVNGSDISQSGFTPIPQQEQQEIVMQSCKLGQYFCSPSTAKQIVRLTLDFLQQRSVVKSNTTASSHSGPITFLEPSCGHGDVVWQLLQDLRDKVSLSGQPFRVLAYDIDKRAIKMCQERFQHVQNDGVLDWIHGDFLKTTGTSDCHHQTSPKMQRANTLVVLGGPPYTSGAGSGERMERDLPLAFFVHCATVWDAAFIAFILPVRYKKHPMCLAGWTVETHELAESSTFFFQGQEALHQPSIIQCYSRAD